MVAGGTLVFGGELSEFARRSCVAALAIAFLVLGAGFMTALFGVGGAGAGHAGAAVAAGEEMLRQLPPLNARLQEEKMSPIAIGIGIHTGRAVVGCIGSPRRMEFTAIGSTVNLASRIESLTKIVGETVLLSARTRAALRQSWTLQELPPQRVKDGVFTINLFFSNELRMRLRYPASSARAAPTAAAVASPLCASSYSTRPSVSEKSVPRNPSCSNPILRV